MDNQRWLAIYIDDHGQIGAAMIETPDDGEFPFGVTASQLGMPGASGGVAFVEMPRDPEFRPMIVDNDQDEEVELNFIQLRPSA